MTRQEIYRIIIAERLRQEELHPFNHDSELYLLSVLVEEVGEVAKALQEGSNVVEELIRSGCLYEMARIPSLIFLDVGKGVKYGFLG